jgi:hypothetical protein
MESIKLDTFAESVFRDLGYDTESDTHLLSTFISYKRAKDFLQPGRLTADGYATIVALTEMSRRISETSAPAAPAAKPKPAPKKKDAEPVQKIETEVDTESPFGQD